MAHMRDFGALVTDGLFSGQYFVLYLIRPHCIYGIKRFDCKKMYLAWLIIRPVTVLIFKKGNNFEQRKTTHFHMIMKPTRIIVLFNFTNLGRFTLFVQKCNSYGFFTYQVWMIQEVDTIENLRT
ncbi:hypothetical protein HUJ04_010054 [Dendroctonus ponderosae]|nr:hypothetical protein HUJ04_010054 [Dendroctonus ponderosae]